MHGAPKGVPIIPLEIVSKLDLATLQVIRHLLHQVDIFFWRKGKGIRWKNKTVTTLQSSAQTKSWRKAPICLKITKKCKATNNPRSWKVIRDISNTRMITRSQKKKDNGECNATDFHLKAWHCESLKQGSQNSQFWNLTILKQLFSTRYIFKKI